MLPFGVTIPATVPQGSETPEGIMNNPVYQKWLNTKIYEDKTAYLEIKRQTRRMIIAEKNEKWHRKCLEINRYIVGEESVLKRGNLFKKLEHQKKKVYTYK
jgi:uncharacterized protein YacL (UPF0231 family)